VSVEEISFTPLRLHLNSSSSSASDGPSPPTGARVTGCSPDGADLARVDVRILHGDAVLYSSKNERQTSRLRPTIFHKITVMVVDRKLPSGVAERQTPHNELELAIISEHDNHALPPAARRRELRNHRSQFAG